MPHAWLPLIGWRWFVAILPVLVLYGASSNAQVREFGIYYAMVTVPFLVIGSATGALVLMRALFAREAAARWPSAPSPPRRSRKSSSAFRPST